MNKDQLKKLEADLWSAADKRRANFDLRSSEYPMLDYASHGRKWVA